MFDTHEKSLSLKFYYSITIICNISEYIQRARFSNLFILRAYNEEREEKEMERRLAR